MPDTKVTFFFNDRLQDYGWTETWWYSGSTNTDDGYDAATPLAQARCNLLGVGVILSDIRVSLSTTPQQSRLYAGLPASLNAEGHPFYSGAVGPTFDFEESPAVALECIKVTTNGPKGMLYLAGFPDPIYAANKDPRQLDGPFKNRIDAFRAAIKAGKWGYYSRSIVNPAAAIGIIGATQAGDRLNLLTTGVGTLTVGSKVYVKGARWKGIPQPRFGGVYSLTGVTSLPPTLQVQWQPLNGSFVYSANSATLWPLTPGVVQILGFLPTRWVSHKRGAPFKRRRGRARRRFFA